MTVLSGDFRASRPSLTLSPRRSRPHYRLSKRNVQQLLADCFGVELALGSISALERATSETLQEPVTQVRRFVQQQPVVHVDETGWRETNQLAWLWVAVCRNLNGYCADAL